MAHPTDHSEVDFVKPHLVDVEVLLRLSVLPDVALFVLHDGREAGPVVLLLLRVLVAFHHCNACVIK